ncbi:DUF1793-domain-containing protein [Flagelloscypha sp. PMI_526]|nr:DUF1793-domain-containing protein [Flagelloscypha sp. PMI_526]
MRLSLGISTLLSLCAATYAASWTATPLQPPSYPLAVRGPYLSAWLPQKAGQALNDVWPQFWAGQILGWAGFAKVNGTAYSFLGSPAVSGSTFTKATQISAEVSYFQYVRWEYAVNWYTTTQSIFKLRAGPVDLTVTFFSPVEPNDYVKHTLPFSYFTVSAASNDGASHSVQVYSDISGEWASRNNGLTINWSTSTGNIFTHQVQLAGQALYSEVGDGIQHGAAYYSTPSVSGLTYKTGADTTVRAQFIANGKLDNGQDTNFRPISSSWPVFAFSHDLGSVSSASAPVVISVGHVRDPAINYVTANGMQSRSIYAWSQFSSVTDMISSFLGDYSAALGRAQTLDAKVHSEASAISADYAAIVELSVRQAFGAYETTISKNSDGSWNTDDILTFQKEISSNGNMNTIDVIFPAWPLYLYFNPKLGSTVLNAVLQYQTSGLYPNKWSIHDIGAHYPNATGHNDGGDEAMPVEESGNMLAMALSYTLKTGDNSFIERWYNVFDQFTQYLIEDSLIPAEQLSTDDFAGTLANQTNLAIKGMVGIGAMAKIADILGHSDTSANYTSIAKDYVSRFTGLGGKSKTEAHLTLSYNNDVTWGLSYNLFGDKLLDLNLFPAEIYQMQTAWYKTKVNQFGVPLDTRHTYTKSDWEIWTAAIVSDTDARDQFISHVKNYLTSGVNDMPFSDWYETTNGASVGFRARPVAGGHLALLVV